MLELRRQRAVAGDRGPAVVQHLAVGTPMLIIGSTVKNMPGLSSGPVPARPAWTDFGLSWNSRPRPWPQSRGQPK
jgi:hypothetical protein